MSESKSASVVFTNSSLLAKNAQATADSAKTAAEVAQNQAITAQRTADGKNSIYRGSDPSTVPTAGLKAGDLYFTENAIYTWTGTAWEKTVSDTTGAEIHAKVEAAMQESQKSVADLKADVESKVSEINSNLSATNTDLTNVKTDLEDTKKSLATTASDLKADLSAVSSDLSVTKTNLENTKTSLSTTVENLQKQTGQLSGSLETANSKIEYNSKAIAEVKHTAEEISTTVSNIRVGGRNLLTNTRTLSGIWNGATETVDGFTVAKATQTNNGYYDPFAWYGLTNIKSNTDYVLTFYAKASKQTLIYSYLYNIGTDTVYADGSTPNTLTTDFQRYIVHFHTMALPAGRAVNCLPVRLTENGVTAWIYGVQLEEGNTATQWQPNPDDTDQAISKVSQTADAIRADLTNAKGDIASVKATANSLQSQITDNKNNISSVKQTADSLTTRMANAEGNVSSLQQTAQGLTTRVTNTEGNVSTLQQTTNKLQSDLTNAKGDISSLQQTASGLTSRVGNAESNISQLQQTADSLTTTVGKMPEQWQQAINDKASAQVLTSNVDMNNLTTAGTYLIKDFSAKNSPIGAWFMATVEATADHTRVVQRVKKDDANVAYERSSKEGGWTDWERIATGTDVSSIKQTMDSITTRVTNTEGDVSTLRETANSLNAYVRGSKGSKTLESILSMDPNNSTIAQVVNGQVVAAINTSSDGSVKIDGKTLHITASTWIDNAVIKSAMIDSIDASKITTGTLDASHIKVINLDANSITTGSLSAALYSVTDFTNYSVSASNTWDFDCTKSPHGNWFLNGETTADHVYNGPKDVYGNKLTPYMYVTSRGSADGTRFTVTVWKDNDPTQYQRVWNGSSWSDWVMLPNSQNLISAINLSPDSVKISGKNIELNGNTRIADGFTLSADKIRAGTLNGMTITGSKFIANTDNGNLFGTLWKNYQVVVDNTEVNIHGTDSSSNDWEAILTSDSLYLQMVNDNNTWTKSVDINTTGPQPYIKLINSGPNAGQYSSTYIGSEQIETPTLAITNSGTPANIDQGALYVGNLELTGHHIRVVDDQFLMVSNHAGTNFDGNGSVGFQVYNGIVLGQNTIGAPGTELYFQRGNVVDILNKKYSDAPKLTLHADHIASQSANTVTSRLSTKTDITPVTYDRALMAVQNTDMYDYRYTTDDTGQHYVSGIIDDVNPDPQYHMDEMLINKERTARIDSNLVGYHHVVIQKLLERVAALEEKVK